MERVCFQLQVKPERLDEYKARHGEVWPDMLRALVNAGWSNYSLFLSESGMLIGYVETEDFAAAQAAMEATEVNARWQAEMKDFMVLPEGARPDTGFIRLQEVFHVG